MSLVVGPKNSFVESFQKLFIHPNKSLFSQLSSWQNNFKFQPTDSSQFKLTLLGNTGSFYGPNACLLALLNTNPPLNPIQYSSTSNPCYLLGKNDIDQALIFQWINYSFETIATTTSSQKLTLTSIANKLNTQLVHSNFLVSSYLSLADYFVYELIKPFSNELITKQQQVKNEAVLRWFLFVGKLIDGGDERLVNEIQTMTIEQEGEKKEKKKNDTVVVKEKKNKPTATNSQPIDDRPLICKIDIRVGHIRSVSQHPNADGLYMEEVDFGEERSRIILSGLAKCLPMEALNDKLAVFVTNLKAANLRGIKSEGMILAATSSQDGSVELLVPPVGCKPGDKVILEGVEESLFVADAVLDSKKKVMETVKEDLVADASGIATWKSQALIVAGKGRLTLPTIRNSPIQ